MAPPCWRTGRPEQRGPRTGAATLGDVEGLNSNLNLNGRVSPRVMPRIGEWAPQDVPATRSKRRMRWIVIGLLVAVTLAVVGLGWYAYTVLMGA